MEEVTYGALKKPSARKEMLEESMVSLGTQAGNYGIFTEEARILTLIGATEIKAEIKNACDTLQVDQCQLMELFPTLKELIS